MARKVIIACAVTGGAALSHRSKYVPITPKQIADECISAAKAGAAVVHIHVRNPETGVPSVEFDLYKEVVDRIKQVNEDVLINLTTGPGARFIRPVDGGMIIGEESFLLTPTERTTHISALNPDICSLDIGAMNMGEACLANQPSQLRMMGSKIVEAGVKPEIEVFDLGHIRLAADMISKGELPANPFFQLCLGISWGAPATTQAMLQMVSMLPENAIWSAFGISRMQMPMAAQSVILGGHVRVGLEDNLYLSAGQLSNGNAPLVDKAVAIIENIGEDVATPSEAAELLSLQAAKNKN